MEKQVVINIHGYPIICNLFYAKRNANRFSFSGGQINIQVKENFPLHLLKAKLERCLSVEKVKELHSEPYFGYNYVDILGERRNLVILEEGMNSSSINDVILKRRSDLDKMLHDYSLQILTSRVRKYEKIMEIDCEYEVKITNMRSCLGKNYYKKKLLTFDKDLIHYSLDIIDSIVIHELSHYFYQNHSKNFYNKVLFYCPTYFELQRKLTKGVRK